ncbi:hypothetical protein [Endozoicomonas sp. Mp262]|uniref:hypothetical protein n=1 Tax=Endozoicomonas sp. Mp262 TaxID=2919499 RepID=UPI0021DAE017
MFDIPTLKKINTVSGKGKGAEKRGEKCAFRILCYTHTFYKPISDLQAGLRYF